MPWPLWCVQALSLIHIFRRKVQARRGGCCTAKLFGIYRLVLGIILQLPADIRRQRPVSYTHLDVYKRQVHAYLVKTAFQPDFELDDARAVAAALDVPLTVVEADVLAQACLLYTSRCV